MDFILSTCFKKLTRWGLQIVGVYFLLSIVGSVAQAQFILTGSITAGQVTITTVSGSGTTLVIPDTMYTYPVTAIAAGVFKNIDVNSVTIGNNVTDIGDSAFSGSSLTSLTLGNNIASIGVSAFEGCSVTSVIFPASLKSLASGAFNSCGYLQYVIFMGYAPSFGVGVFDNVSSNFIGYCFSPAAPGVPDAVNAGVYSPVTPWLISKGISYNANVQSAPRGDGVSLLMAYALNLDPTRNQSAFLPKPIVTGGQMKLTFYAGSAGITYSVEASPDLKSWSTSGVTVSGPDINGLETASITISGSNRFMRLKVVKP